MWLFRLKLWCIPLPHMEKTPKLKLLKVLKVLRTDSRKWLKLMQIKKNKNILYNIN